jgi:hypothetical protein
MPLPNLSGLGGGGGPGPLGPINVGSLVQAATTPPGIQFLQGLATLPGAFQQAQSDAADAQTKRLQAKDFQMKIAQNQWDQSVSMIQKNPSLAGTPAMIRQMTANSAILGYQLPMAKNGSIDPSVWGTSFNEFMKDKAFSDTWNSSTPAQRHALAAERGIVGIPEAAFNIDPIYSAKETQLLGQLHLNEVMGADRRRNLDARTAAQDTGDYAKVSYYQRMSDAALINANAHRDDVAQKVHIAQIRADSVIQASKNRATTSNKYWQYLVHTSEQGSQQAHTSLNEAIRLRDAYAATGVDPDDPDLVRMNKEVDDARAAVTTADERRTTAVESTPDMNDISSRHVTQQSGKPQATVQNVHANTSLMQPGTLPNGQRGFRDNATGQMYNTDGSPYSP